MKNKIKVLMTMPNGYERVNRIHSLFGISDTCTARDYKDPSKILIRIVDRMCTYEQK